MRLFKVVINHTTSQTPTRNEADGHNGTQPTKITSEHNSHASTRSRTRPPITNESSGNPETGLLAWLLLLLWHHHPPPPPLISTTFIHFTLMMRRTAFIYCFSSLSRRRRRHGIHYSQSLQEVRRSDTQHHNQKYLPPFSFITLSHCNAASTVFHFRTMTGFRWCFVSSHDDISVSGSNATESIDINQIIGGFYGDYCGQ